MNPEIKTEKIHLGISDGTKMMAYVARPKNSNKSCGVMVLQEAFGVNKHIRAVTERFAREGYVAVAPELFHRTAPEGSEFDYENFQAVTPHIQAITPDQAFQDLEATYKWLSEDPQVHHDRVASVGYCMGGRLSFLANAKLPLKAAASYYGARIAPQLLPEAKNQHGPILLFWGGLDSHIGPDQYRAVSDALREAQKNFVEVIFADAGHGFNCDARSSYNKNASTEAWALLLAFLKNHL